MIEPAARPFQYCYNVLVGQDVNPGVHHDDTEPMWLRRAALAGGACTALSIGEGVRRTWGVEACEVPVGSNLDYIGSKQTVWHQDCYKLSIPIDSLPKKSLVRLTDSFCSAFFRCGSHTCWPAACMPCMKGQTVHGRYRAIGTCMQSSVQFKVCYLALRATS